MNKKQRKFLLTILFMFALAAAYILLFLPDIYTKQLLSWEAFTLLIFSPLIYDCYKCLKDMG